MEPVRTPPSSSTEDEISEDLLHFFKQRSYSFADFTKRFPNLDFKRELERIINHPGLKDRHRYHARTHLEQLRSNQSRSSANSPSPPPITNVSNHATFYGAVHGAAIVGTNTTDTLTIDSNVSTTVRPSKRRRTGPEDNDKGEDEGNEDEAEAETEADGEDEGEDERDKTSATPIPPLQQSPTDPGLILPSGASLTQLLARPHSEDAHFTRRRILFFERDWVKAAFQPADLQFLEDQFPTVPKVSPYFDAALEACRPLLKDFRHDPVRPIPTSPENPEEYHIWHYVSTAVMHYVMNYKTLADRASTHGEVWADVNIWSTLWDFAFLKSSTLTLDRKELRVAVKTITIKHDGILRAVLPTCGRNLGFLEVKPQRHNTGDGRMAIDCNKVIDSMVATLLVHKTPGAVVTGILCHGMKMTILRATLVAGNVVLFKELTQVIQPRQILQAVKHCWMIKLALEESYDRILDSMSDSELI